MEKQIISLEQKWAQAQKASDANAIAPMLADSFVIVFSDGRLMNKAQALDNTKKSKMESVEASDMKVSSYGKPPSLPASGRTKVPMPTARPRMIATVSSIRGTSQLV